jgi:hypothetical protein
MACFLAAVCADIHVWTRLVWACPADDRTWSGIKTCQSRRSSRLGFTSVHRPQLGQPLLEPGDVTAAFAKVTQVDE